MSRVVNFKIDGHKVLNPLDFRARKVEAVLELILTTRQAYAEVKIFTRNRQDFFFTEIGRSELNVLQKVEQPPLSLLRLGDPYSFYMVMEPAAVGQVITRGKVAWTNRAFIRTIEENWQLESGTAEEVYGLYLRKEMSPRAFKRFDLLMKRETEKLFAALKDVRLKGSVFIDSDRPLPLELPLKKGREVFLPAPLTQLLDRFGFKLEPADWPLPPARTFSLLAPFLDHHSDRSDSTVNHWLRRHLSWLGSSL